MTSTFEAPVRACGRSVLKGSRHTAERSVELTAAGVVGNRRHALVTGGGVLRTIHHLALIGCQAALRDGALHVTLPDGRQAIQPGTGVEQRLDYWGREVRMRVADGPVAQLLSEFLGREVQLGTAVQPRSLVYGDPVSLITTGELASADVPISEWGRFRANLLVEHPEPLPPGARVTIGEAVLQLTDPIPRCRVIDAEPMLGQTDQSLFEALPSKSLAIGATVLTPGPVRVGDRATIHHA